MINVHGMYSIIPGTDKGDQQPNPTAFRQKKNVQGCLQRMVGGTRTIMGEGEDGGETGRT